jgi:hypothetical protein
MLAVLNQRGTATQDDMSKTMARGLTPYPAPPFFAPPWPSEELKARGEVQPCTPGGWREHVHEIEIARAKKRTRPSSLQPSSAHCRR